MKHSVIALISCAILSSAGAQTGTFKKDDNTAVPWQVIMEGATNTNLQLLSGVNTSSTPFAGLQAFYQTVGPLPLVLQNAGGNVGIGTQNPTARLYVNSGDNSIGSVLATNTESGELRVRSYTTQPGVVQSFGIIHSFYNDENNGFLKFYRGSSTYGGFITLGSGGAERMRIDANGSVGIGTTTPGAGTIYVGDKLDVEGGYMRLGCSTGPFFNFYHPSAAANLKFTRIGTVNGDMYFDAVNDAYNAASTRLFIQNTTGNIGIGTTSPTQKLAVNGAIRAKEVIVDTSWSDYVFERNYKLQPLSEVERLIKSEGHLAGIPSAKEVAERGVRVGDIEAALLAKIEELTLHQIEQEKRLSAQQHELETLKNENTAMQSRFAAMLHNQR